MILTVGIATDMGFNEDFSHSLHCWGASQNSYMFTGMGQTPLASIKPPWHREGCEFKSVSAGATKGRHQENWSFAVFFKSNISKFDIPRLSAT